MTDEATPRPWRFIPWHVEEGPPVVRAPAGHIVGTFASDDDAQLTALAVNAYDPSREEKVKALVEACKAVDARIKAFGAPGDYGYNTEMGKKLFDLIREQYGMRAALSALGETV